MTRKKSNVKALALAVTCAILAGGGIGLEPVYAADTTLELANGKITAGTITGTVGSQAITDGTITGGTFTGKVTLTSDNIKTAIDGVDISTAKVGSAPTSLTIVQLATNTQKITYDDEKGTMVDGHLSISSNGGITIGDETSQNHVVISNESVVASNSVTANIIASGLTARMSDGNVVAKNDLYIGYTSPLITGATYDNSKFAVKGEDGSFKAANGAFTVDKDGNTVVTGGNGSVTIAPGGDGIVFTRNNGDQKVQIDSGYVKASGYVEAPKFIIDSGNFFKKEGNESQLLVSDSGGRVNIGSGTITATGDVNVGGNLYVGGTSTFKGETEFKDGIKTDTINEANEGKGVTVDGVLLKDNGISAANGEFKVNGATGDITTTGNITAKKGGTIGGAVINETALTIGGTKLDSVEGITTNKLKIGGMTLTGTSLDTGTATFEVNGVAFNQGQVTAQDNKGFVAGTSSFKQGSLIVDANNKLETTNGLTTEKAAVKGTLDVSGKATFGTAANTTTIEGNTITTDTLKADKLILGASGDATVEVDKDGSLKAANGKFKVDKDGSLKAADGAFFVDEKGITNFKKDGGNESSIEGGNITATATDAANHTSSVLLHDSTGLHVTGTKSGKTSAFDFDVATGIGTFTGQDGTKTTINGSNLTLTDGDNKTELNAGGVTFTGTAGSSTKQGTQTTIDGGIITTDTLNVERINLGENILDSNGNPHGSNLSMDKDGNFSAAGGNFTVKGGTDADKGAFTNKVGNTTLQTDTTGASMSHKEGDVTSNVSVGANKANVSVGTSSIDVTKDSITSKVGESASSTIKADEIVDKVGDYSVTTNDKGTTFANGSDKTTNINGGTITTGKLITDELVITGNGAAGGTDTGTGSIAFGGNGTIKSDIQDGDKNTNFTTDINGVTTTVTDGTTTTANSVTAAGNTNTVTKDETHKSEFNQGLTSIGGVVTNGEIKVAQKLDGEKGNITSEVTDKDGKTSTLVQNGTGLTFTDTANDGKETRIDGGDVSIGSKDGDRINLSDLGQIKDLDSELTARKEYTDNPTAVGAINAEAAIRREEVARLDNRIDDVNTRVDKVGAMAAAIASLKSIGYDPQAPSEFSIGLGQYKGETGVAMGFFHYPNKNFMINVSLSTAGGETMGGIGATWRFGHKSPQKLLEEQREAQAKKELAAAEKYQAAAKLAKEAQERAEYAAKLARQAQVSADNAKAAADATQAKHFG